MANSYYTILTDTGVARIAGSALGKEVKFKNLALGSGASSPNATDTVLQDEKWRGEINHIYIHEDNKNWIVLETVVPASVGGFTIRELGVYDVDGDLLARGSYPDTYKPVLLDGSTKDLYIRVILEVSNTEHITLEVDPNVVVASKQDYNLLEVRVSKNEDDIKALGDLKREINRLKVQLELNDRAPMSGGTFYNLLDGIGYKNLELDNTITTLEIQAGKNTSTVKVESVDGFKKGQEVTIYNKDYMQDLIIKEVVANNNEIKFTENLNEVYIKGSTIARGTVEIVNKRLDVSKWGTFTIEEVI